MATDSFTVNSIDSGVHNTVSGTDTITVTLPVTSRLQVVNRSTAGFSVRTDGAAAVALADGTRYVPPGMVFEWNAGSGTTVVSIVGNGDAYSVQGMPYGTFS